VAWWEWPQELLKKNKNLFYLDVDKFLGEAELVKRENE